VRAALDYHLTYQDMKNLARTGMEHSFLPGQSLWAAPDVFTHAVTACEGETPGGKNTSAGCKRFLDGSEKAAAQWELEQRFAAFEARF
jgi:adenosine deaminase